ncbi:PREDICTED: uncharacterized protein LOC105559783 [Vollenhovia emeryi]|uniref:uncharacterized protein LOC105559783 n=1 Tax=Vollenhovia emeryi TaxID=411798 RepID=UPI0005F484A2|nr:PREDICTED: uncharacterized protein LOC105559783 [Vollenhovia emeryi]
MFTSLCQTSAMAPFRFFTAAILLLSTTSVKTYSVPYQGVQLPFSITPQLIYTSESNPAFSGYSYTTQDFNGGESNVVFTTGADSKNRLKDEMDSRKMPEEYSQTDKSQENMMSSEQSKSESTEKQNLDANTKVPGEGKKSANSQADNNLIEQQPSFQRVSLVDVSYPALRENFLNLPLFPRYQISPNVMPSQYYPYNPYARLELPLHNFDIYNPVSLFYRVSPIIPGSNSESTSTAAETMKPPAEPHVVSSQTNVTNSASNSAESNTIASRFNPESTTNGEEETSSGLPTSASKLESTTTSEKVKAEPPTSATAMATQSSTQRTAGSEASSTELASTETSPLTEKSSTATAKGLN